MADDIGLPGPSNITWRGHTGIVEYGGGDKGMFVAFYTRPIHNPALSREKGRPIYEDKIYVKVMPPGERWNIVDRPIQESDKRRWPQQWQQFQQNREQVPSGTPTGVLYPDHPAIVAMLQAYNVHTVEQLAALSGPAIENVGMGAQRYVNDAQKYLEVANKGVSASQMRAELEERDRELRVLRKQVTDMAATIQELRDTNRPPDLQAIQQAIAGAMGRPQHVGAGFDPQAAMIASTHPTALQARQTAAKGRARAKLR